MKAGWLVALALGVFADEAVEKRDLTFERQLILGDQPAFNATKHGIMAALHAKSLASALNQLDPSLEIDLGSGEFREERTRFEISLMLVCILHIYLCGVLVSLFFFANSVTDYESIPLPPQREVALQRLQYFLLS